MEFKEEEEEEQVIWWVLEVELDFKDLPKEEEQVILSVLEVEFKEDGEEEQVIIGGCWRSKWSSRRKRRRNRSF